MGLKFCVLMVACNRIARQNLRRRGRTDAVAGTGGAPPKVKSESADVTEVVLVSGVAGAVDPKARVKVIDLNRTQEEMAVHDDVEPAPNAMANALLLLLAEAPPVDGVVNIGIGVGMRGAEQRFSKRLYPAGVLLELRAKHVGEQVALQIARDRVAGIV